LPALKSKAGMIEVKIVCIECKGKKYHTNNDKKTGRTACFSCLGKGWLLHSMDEDEAAKLELMQMPKDKLALVDHDKYKWQCYVEGCTKFTAVKDYGIAPHYFTRWGWKDLSVTVMRCYKHAQAEDERAELLLHKPGNGENHLIPLMP
jgi:hypothetical protein